MGRWGDPRQSAQRRARLCANFAKKAHLASDPETGGSATEEERKTVSSIAPGWALRQRRDEIGQRREGLDMAVNRSTLAASASSALALRCSPRTAAPRMRAAFQRLYLVGAAPLAPGFFTAVGAVAGLTGVGRVALISGRLSGSVAAPVPLSAPVTGPNAGEAVMGGALWLCVTCGFLTVVLALVWAKAPMEPKLIAASSTTLRESKEKEERTLLRIESPLVMSNTLHCSKDDRVAPALLPPVACLHIWARHVTPCATLGAVSIKRL